MTKMRRALAGFAFVAMLALSLTAMQGTAWARTQTPPPTVIVPPTTIGGLLNSLGVTWED